MRILDAHGIKYIPHSYDSSLTEGEKVAAALGEDAGRVFKTLVTTDGKGGYFVFVVPVNASLNLKKAAAAAGIKSAEMIKQKQLLPLTGYIHGGCSPIGMKKPFKTFVDESAQLYDGIFVSAGKVGFQAELSPADLVNFIGAEYADLVEE